MALIQLDVSEGVATITLNRPEKLNAFAGTMREELLEQLSSAVRADAGAVVITGAGRAFCAGGDVEFMRDLQKQNDIDGLSKLLNAGRQIVNAIRALRRPVIASINGVAAGAGCNLALACDYRIASGEATLVESFVRIGLHPDWGGTFFLPRLVGSSRALEILATGRSVSAPEALEIGMVDRVVPPEQLSEETRRLARSLANGPRSVIGDIKKAIYASTENDLAAQLELETAHQIEAFQSKESEAGMEAFLRKRREK